MSIPAGSEIQARLEVGCLGKSRGRNAPPYSERAPDRDRATAAQATWRWRSGSMAPSDLQRSEGHAISVLVREPIPRECAVERLASHIENWQTRGSGVWAVLEKASNQLVGHSGFLTPEAAGRIELIYVLGRHWWGRGFATEAAAACLRHGSESLDFTEIVALSLPENEPWIHVMLKLGFVSRTSFLGLESSSSDTRSTRTHSGLPRMHVWGATNR